MICLIDLSETECKSHLTFEYLNKTNLKEERKRIFNCVKNLV